MRIVLTEDEQTLLRQTIPTFYEIVADPDEGLRSLRDRRGGGGYLGFKHSYTNTKLHGSWRHHRVIDHHSDGRPRRMLFDEPHLEVSITLTRLHKWAESLPAELRERARVAYSVNTRNLTDLEQIVLEAIDMSAPARQETLW